MFLSKEIIDTLNSVNGVAQRINLGEQLSDAFYSVSTQKSTSSDVPEEKHIKIKNHKKLEGSVNIQTIKSEYNLLIDDPINAGLMEPEK